MYLSQDTLAAWKPYELLCGPPAWFHELFEHAAKSVLAARPGNDGP